MTRPDILYAIHQVAKYSPDPRRGHAEAIFYIIEYLKEIGHIGLCFKPDASKGFQCYGKIKSSQQLTLAWPNLGMAGLYF